MRKLLISMVIMISFVSSSVNPLKFHEVASAQKPIPPYAKWGTYAMEKTKEKYPNANIIDYLHIGRIPGTPTTTEKFKLWLKDNNREFGVFIDIQFDTKTEQVMKVTFKESSR
jgi:hypothetical protein